MFKFPSSKNRGLSGRQRILKRSFDLILASVGLLFSFPLILAVIIMATIDTRECGIFAQERIGRHGKVFRVHKVRTMRTALGVTTTVTTAADPRITRFGALLRRYKLDELPQLWDVLVGSMSAVGPRPDVAGWADALSGSDRLVLSVRPGITGPASIYFRDEESILATVEDPIKYNREVIWPTKLRLNIQYVQNWSLRRDITLIYQTLIN